MMAVTKMIVSQTANDALNAHNLGFILHMIIIQNIQLTFKHDNITRIIEMLRCGAVMGEARLFFLLIIIGITS